MQQGKAASLATFRHTWVDQDSLEGLLEGLEVSVQQVFFFLVGGAHRLAIAAVNIFSVCCCRH